MNIVVFKVLLVMFSFIPPLSVYDVPYINIGMLCYFYQDNL